MACGRELYTQAPVTVRFPDAEDSQFFSLVVTPLSEKEVMLSGFSNEEEAVVKIWHLMTRSLLR